MRGSNSPLCLPRVARIAAVQGVHRARPTAPRSQDAGFGYFVAALVDAGGPPLVSAVIGVVAAVCAAVVSWISSSPR